MENNYISNKLKTDIIAFAAVLAAMLFIAWLISSAMSAVRLTDPLELPNSGLSVSMPKGAGWHTDSNWQHQDNYFVLNSIYAPSGAMPLISASTRYMVASQHLRPKEHFQSKAKASKLNVGFIGQMQGSGLKFKYAILAEPESSYVMMLGTAKMDYGRGLEIEVQDTTGDIQRTQRIFQSIADNLQIQPNDLLAAGAEIVSLIKQNGLAYYLTDGSSQNSFLIKDPEGNIAGFSSDIAINQNIDSSVITNGLMYIADKSEIFTSFEVCEDMERFVCRSQRVRLGSREAVNMSYEGGSLRLLRAAQQPMQYYTGPAMLPYLSMELAIRTLAEKSGSEVLLDILTPDGALMPSVVSVETTDEKNGHKAFLIRMEPAVGDMSYEWTLGKDYSIYRTQVASPDGTLEFEKTDTETIKKLFPQMSDYIFDEDMMRELTIS